MGYVPYIVGYLALATFVVAVIARIIWWVRMPMHVRWELYPVAHEASRASYGGSYLEDVDWWKKPREVSKVAELKAMIPEMVFLVALKEHNPKLWWRSFPFHFGLYLLMGCTVLMMAGGLVGFFAADVMTGGLGQAFHYGVVITGYAGMGLSLLGGLGLLHRRLTDPELADFTAPADIFNLLFFLAAFGLAAVYVVVADPSFATVQGFVTSLVTFNVTTSIGGEAPIFFALTVLALGALVAYIPLTHMSHFVGKYFSYHAIRWNDTPNLRGGPQEAVIQKLLMRPVTWAAPHVDGRGKKTWADLATEEMKK